MARPLVLGGRNLGRIGALRSGERPVGLIEPRGRFVLGCGGPFVDPAREQRDLLGGERGALQGHAFDRSVASNGFDQTRFRGLCNHHGLAGFSPLEGMCGCVEPQAAARPRFTVTGDAVLREQGLDLLDIIDRRLGGDIRRSRDRLQAESDEKRECAHCECSAGGQGVDHRIE